MTESKTWSVKNVKSWEGHEGLGTQCSVYRNGKKVAIFLDDANGGDADFRWLDTGDLVDITIMAPDYLTDQRPHPLVERTYKGTVEEKILEEHANAIEWQSKYEDDVTFRKDGAQIVSELCDIYESRSRMKKKLNRQTWLRLKDQEYGEEQWSVISRKFTPELHKLLKKQYGANLGEIYNLTIDQA